jgi:hypothetical protein
MMMRNSGEIKTGYGTMFLYYSSAIMGLLLIINYLLK